MRLSSLSRLRSVLTFLSQHPFNREQPGRALWTFAKWQLGSRLVPGPVLVPFVAGTRLAVSPSMSGATGNVYAGLHDFEEMGFLLHLLRPGDRFADVGANVGSYTVLAAGVCGAEVLAFEPGLEALRWLRTNIAINDLGSKVRVLPLAVGRERGEVSFTVSLDTVNHVAPAGESGNDFRTVGVETLDAVMGENAPTLIKMDIEGFESEALAGATATLRSERLAAVIVEINGSGLRYGHADLEIHELLVGAGLSPHGYDPKTRVLLELSSYRREGNTIYLRRPAEVAERLRAAPRVQVAAFGSI